MTNLEKLKDKKYQLHITYDFDVNTLINLGMDFESPEAFFDWMTDTVFNKIKEAAIQEDPNPLMRMIKTKII